MFKSVTKYQMLKRPLDSELRPGSASGDTHAMLSSESRAQGRAVRASAVAASEEGEGVPL